MAGFITAASSAIRTVAGANALSSGADSSFPASNITNRYPYRPWKSSGNVTSGTTYVGADLGAAVALAGIFVDAINITSIEIQASTANTFTSPTGSGTLTVAKNKVSNRYKILYLTAGGPLAGVVRQYWRVLARTSTLADLTTGKMSVGSVCWINSITTWASGTSSYDELPLEATAPNDQFAGGGSEPVVLGNSYAAITLGASPASWSAMRDTLLAILSSEGIGRYFIFYTNRGDTSEAYRVRRTADVTLRQTAPSVITFQNFILEESV